MYHNVPIWFLHYVTVILGQWMISICKATRFGSERQLVYRLKTYWYTGWTPTDIQVVLVLLIIIIFKFNNNNVNLANWFIVVNRVYVYRIQVIWFVMVQVHSTRVCHSLSFNCSCSACLKSARCWALMYHWNRGNDFSRFNDFKSVRWHYEWALHVIGYSRTTSKQRFKSLHYTKLSSWWLYCLTWWQ